MPEPASFFDKLEAAIQRNRSLVCVGLDPNPSQLPQRYRTGNLSADLLAWNRGIIEETVDLVCCFKPNIAFYEALGADGMAVLRDTLALIPTTIPVLLDAKRGDMGNTAIAYAKACFEDLGVDAVTLSPYLGRDSIEPFAAYPGKGMFVLCHTSNASAGDFQSLEINDWRSLDREPNQPLYIHVARRAASWSPNVGLVVGATYPEAIANVRAVAPDVWFLVPGVGAQGGEIAAALAAGQRSDGTGMIISASRSVMLADSHHDAAQTLRDAINQAREELAQPTRPPAPRRHEALIAGLADLQAVKFGDFTLASGAQSPVYIDLRLLVSEPSLLVLAAKAYASILRELPCDRVAGVPYAALPIGTAVAIEADTPLIYPRKEAKTHGLGKQIEGAWQPGDRVVIIEDIITSGGSVIQSAELLRAAGLVVEDLVVLIDREQGGVEKLAAAGIRAHSVFKISEMMETLVDSGRLNDDKRREVLAYIGAN
ncbi:MAG: orotidine-5'-phosphate decarboxylase [Caldilineaceae bacterium]|nr:orotidine-5'-phosphate decarboxylase [Caldilineaceae bacterium]